MLIEMVKGGVFSPSNSSERLSVSGFLQILNVANTAGSAFEIADELKQWEEKGIGMGWGIRYFRLNILQTMR